MLVGSSRVNITPDELCTVSGQMHPRMAKFVHDPIFCNTVVFKEGDKIFSITSNDVVGLNNDMTPELKKILSEKYNVPEKCFAFHAIHTHLAPYTNNGVDVMNQKFVDNWKKAIIQSIDIAMSNLEECDLYSGQGYIECMGWNRRGRRSDGTVEMYWGAWEEGFVGTEGPRDGSVTVLFAKRKSDSSLKVIVPNFSTHPNSVESEYFISADLVGRTRQVLRSVWGEDVDIVYITGAAGNTAPSNLYSEEFTGHWRGEEGWNRSGIYLGSEISKVICETCDPMSDNTLGVEEANLEVDYMDFNKTLDPKKDRTFTEESFNEYKKEVEELSKLGPQILNVTVARVGDTAFCTAPGELYVEFGLDIKAESPANNTIMCELTNGNVGYIPIYEATINGGYSATFPGTRIKEDTGYRITAEAKRMLLKLFND